MRIPLQLFSHREAVQVLYTGHRYSCLSPAQISFFPTSEANRRSNRATRMADITLQPQGMSTHRTSTEDKELVPRGTKASRQLRSALKNTPLQVVQLAAFIALEMMMMPLVGKLVTGGIPGDNHSPQPTFPRQLLDIAVYRGDPQRRVMLPRRLQDLFGR